MRYVMYARKSSEEDERQVQSIPDQVSVLERMAARDGLDIVARVEESKSAKAPGMRPEFTRMLSMIEKRQVDGILCWNATRLFRNQADYGTIAWLLQCGVLQAIKTVDREYRTGDNVVMMAVDAAVATQYVIDLSKSVKRGLSEKAKRGGWPGLAPPGYLNVSEQHDVVKVNVVRPDPDRFSRLRKAWSQMLMGSYTVPQVLRTLNSEGFMTRPTKRMPSKPLSRSTLYKIFRNPFYAGFFRYNGEVIKGNHQPMITESEYMRVQAIIQNREENPSAKTNAFAFSGLMRCATCGAVVTPERKVKRGKHSGRYREYIYYHCSGSRGCPKNGVREEEVERALADLLLRHANYTPEMLKLIECTIRRFLQEAHLDERVELSNLRSQRDQLKSREAGLIDMRANKEITSGQFAERHAAILDEIQALDSRIRRQENVDDDIARAFANAEGYVSRAYREYMYASVERKRLIAMMGTANNVLDNGKVVLRINPLLAFLSTFEPPKGPDNRFDDAIPTHMRPALLRKWHHLRSQILSGEISFPEWPANSDLAA